MNARRERQRGALNLHKAKLGASPPTLPSCRQRSHAPRQSGDCFSDRLRASGEVPLNKIIADLLDPRGPHGRGAFLKLFLGQVEADLHSYQLEDWVVVPSYQTRRGRYADIALFKGSSAAIYIESKPWAAEGDEQLQDHAVDLIGQIHERKWLLFLPGTAREDRT